MMFIARRKNFLESVARGWRFKKSLSVIGKQQPFSVLDLGCGPKMAFLKFLHKKHFPIAVYFGIDPLLDKPNSIVKVNNTKVHCIKKKLAGKLPLPDKSVDLVVGFAFLEHVENPEDFIWETVRVLKDGGKAVFTAPTPRARKILEFLAHKLGILSQREIEEHKTYLDKEYLISIFKNKGSLLKIHHSYFEAKLNNLLVVEKTNTQK